LSKFPCIIEDDLFTLSNSGVWHSAVGNKSSATDSSDYAKSVGIADSRLTIHDVLDIWTF